MTQELTQTVDWLKRVAQPGSRLRLDSRTVRPGDIFVAVPGEHVDGRDFIRVALARGAVAVLMEQDGHQHGICPVPTQSVRGLFALLGDIAAAFYDYPARHMRGLAVTGTNGKTTTTHWMAALLEKLGTPCGLLGTVGCRLGERRFEAPALTTPDAVSLQTLYADLYEAGAKAYAIEASSVGLEQGRLNRSDFHVAVFTNLTRDHLDYHRTMEAYGRAKAKLFAWPGLANAVINADDPQGATMADVARHTGAAVWSCSCTGTALDGADHVLSASAIESTAEGTRFDLTFDGRTLPVQMAQVGLFNVMNLMQAMAAVMACGHDFEKVVLLASDLSAPNGRMQMLRAKGAPLAVVDYCHTPDAVAKALESLRGVARARHGRLKIVFGCGGDRDRGKRPLMGRMAREGADEVYVTSDNPRTEPPAQILADIVNGNPGMTVIEDRREAIHRAIVDARPEDVVLVAGKGHEDYQDIDGVKHHFSDKETVREAFNECRCRVLSAQETK